MKKIVLSFLFSFFVVAITLAQPPERPMGPRGKGPRPSKENVEALKVAFITKHLNLNAEEAQKFWPAYNACFEELKKARQEKKDDVLAFEEAALNIRKKYKNDFKKALGSDERVNKAMGADRAFMSMIKDELQHRRGEQGPQNNNKGGKKGGKNKKGGTPPPPPGQEPSI
jgi:hypothetical protein